LRKGDRLALAVSGGKDSMSMLYSLREILGPNRSVELHVITVDEGIKGYRPGSLPVVKRACKDLDVEFHLISMKKEFGVTMDEVASKKRGPSSCTYCGVLRRRCMNSVARELDSRALCVGLNADDVAQSVLMNVMRNDLGRLTRMAPHAKHPKPGLVSRVVPLRTTPESEDLLYAIVRGIEFHDAECPYYMDAMRNFAREFVNRAEDEMPGTKLSLVSFADAVKARLIDSLGGSPGVCEGCGEPCSKKLCKACQIIASLRERKDIV
jgi:uncharacterized protein (TIGR00269 family)